ncbi:BLUF domain-containing protein [Ekhidna sp.]|uniref:BLUF domain-containing protein n=1 Tax=Ekhidna sp. TaxID=2608089 RepID=UPI003BAA5F5E
MDKELLKSELIEAINVADEKLLRILNAVVNEYLKNKDTPQQEAEDLYRLVYTSARLKNCSDKDVKQILQVSRRNNSKINVTGILIHTKDRFLQVLEGDKDVVMGLYNKIEKDDRHGGSVMRFCESVDQRYFSDWDMVGKRIDNKIAFNTLIDEEKKVLYRSMMDGDLSSYKDEGMRVLKTFLLVS